MVLPIANDVIDWLCAASGDHSTSVVKDHGYLVRNLARQVLALDTRGYSDISHFSFNY